MPFRASMTASNKLFAGMQITHQKFGKFFCYFSRANHICLTIKSKMSRH